MNALRTLVAFPSTASFAQQAALAFEERGMLAAFLTAYVYRDDSAVARLLALAPAGLRAKIEPQLRRRKISDLRPNAIEESAFWEIVRTVADKAGASAPMVDRIWDHLSHSFTRTAGQRLARGGVDAIYAYEYTALEAFRAADRKNVFKILDFPSLNSREFEGLQRREKERYPELRGPYENYFAARFEKRQARRDAEMAAADIIITNSTVTRRSHIAGGADPDRTFAVPYGAPPPIGTLAKRLPGGPLRILWAGTFSIRKGAHYFVDAWRRLNAGNEAVADIFGAIALPDGLWKPAPSGMTFHGSVPRSALFDAYDRADVLMFPTLSDGFGMVVTEAFARGLPVVTTSQAGASDLVAHGNNGLIIESGDANAIEHALRWCLDNREALNDMRPHALDTAKNWQWSDYRHALISTIQTAMIRTGSRSARGVSAAAE